MSVETLERPEVLDELTAMEMLEGKWAEGKFLCVGLDVVEDENGSLYDKAVDIVNATRDIAAAYKPNDAFYASRGAEGIAQLEQLVGYIRALAPEILVIWDAKRADIENTNKGYAKQRERLGAYGMTIQPYLGGTAVEPLLDDPSKLGIVLVHTSNSGADEFQHLQLQTGEQLWEKVAKNVAHDARWKHGSPTAMVMGATFPELIGRARYLAGDNVPILIPGVGKQKGDLDASVRGAMNSSGNGFLINVSSGISAAVDDQGKVTAESIRQAAISFDQEIRRVHQDAISNPSLTYYERQLYEYDSRLVNTMFDVGAIQFGEFLLKSGRIAPIYIDNRCLITDPTARSNVVQLFVDMIRRQEETTGVQADFIAGNPQSGTTWAAIAADRLGRRLVQPRAGGRKDHGTGKLVEGVYESGQTVRLLEDLVTTGTSVFETTDETLTPSGLLLAGVVSLVCRDQAGAQAIADRGIPYDHSITLERITGGLVASGRLDELEPKMRDTVKDYLGVAY